MVDVKNKLQTIKQELTIIILAIQKIVDMDIIHINNVQHNIQYELLKDLIHILNTATNVLDTILYLSDDD